MVDFKKLLEERRGMPGNLNNYAERIEESKQRHNIENRPNLNVSITPAGVDYAIKFGYDAALLKKLKDAVPESERAWHKGRKVWLVSPEAIQQAVIAIEKHVGRTVVVPPVDQLSAPEVLEKSFLLEYLGTTKDRGPKGFDLCYRAAYGSVNGEWSAEFPEEILKNFFEVREANQKFDGLQTLYQALCVFEKVSPEEIKRAYKRLALQWHPDVSKEEGSEEMFIKINEAYKVLIDPEKKARYDAGLYFERQGQEQDMSIRISRYTGYGYRAPLRCGQITARGTVRLMRFVVTEILKWDDVTKINADGQVLTMLSQWPKGADTFQILWI